MMVEARQNTAEGETCQQGFIALIRRAAVGDQAALGDLYESTSHLVYGLAVRIVGDPAVAEDVCLGFMSRCGVEPPLMIPNGVRRLSGC